MILRVWAQKSKIGVLVKCTLPLVIFEHAGLIKLLFTSIMFFMILVMYSFFWFWRIKISRVNRESNCLPEMQLRELWRVYCSPFQSLILVFHFGGVNDAL